MRVNLAKTFGPLDAYKFINGILDRVAIDKGRLKCRLSNQTNITI